MLLNNSGAHLPNHHNQHRPQSCGTTLTCIRVASATSPGASVSFCMRHDGIHTVPQNTRGACARLSCMRRAVNCLCCPSGPYCLRPSEIDTHNSLAHLQTWLTLCSSDGCTAHVFCLTGSIYMHTARTMIAWILASTSR